MILIEMRRKNKSYPSVRESVISVMTVSGVKAFFIWSLRDYLVLMGAAKITSLTS